MSSVRPGGTRRPVVRLSPVRLPASVEVRLRRSVPGAAYREDMAQLLVPIPDGERPADAVLRLVEDLIPAASSGDSGEARGAGTTL